MPIENLRLVCAVIALAGAAYAQEAGGFAGTWKGEQAGKAHLLMSVASGSPLKIAFSTAHVRVGDTGEIDPCSSSRFDSFGPNLSFPRDLY
jgi:hypothetical protein